MWPVWWSYHFCLPCLVADTAFDEGAGVIKIPGGVAQKFRALLTVADSLSRIEKDEQDSSPVMRCFRKVRCCSKPCPDDPLYTLAVEGPINVATQLVRPRKGEVISAIVTWRSSKELTLLSLATINEQGAELDLLKKFFREEVDFFQGASKVISLSADSTPSKKQLEANKEANSVTTPEAWSKRFRST